MDGDLSTSLFLLIFEVVVIGFDWNLDVYDTNASWQAPTPDEESHSSASSDGEICCSPASAGPPTGV
jgi:hypothetical protein